MKKKNKRYLYALTLLTLMQGQSTFADGIQDQIQKEKAISAFHEIKTLQSIVQQEKGHISSLDILVPTAAVIATQSKVSSEKKEIKKIEDLQKQVKEDDVKIHKKETELAQKKKDIYEGRDHFSQRRSEIDQSKKQINLEEKSLAEKMKDKAFDDESLDLQKRMLEMNEEHHAKLKSEKQDLEKHLKRKKEKLQQLKEELQNNPKNKNQILQSAKKELESIKKIEVKVAKVEQDMSRLQKSIKVQEKDVLEQKKNQTRINAQHEAQRQDLQQKKSQIEKEEKKLENDQKKDTKSKANTVKDERNITKAKKQTDQKIRETLNNSKLTKNDPQLKRTLKNNPLNHESLNNRLNHIKKNKMRSIQKLAKLGIWGSLLAGAINIGYSFFSEDEITLSQFIRQIAIDTIGVTDIGNGTLDSYFSSDIGSNDFLSLTEDDAKNYILNSKELASKTLLLYDDMIRESLNCQNSQPLHCLLEMNNIDEEVNPIFKNGYFAYIDINPESIYEQNEKQENALHIASKNKSSEAILKIFNLAPKLLYTINSDNEHPLAMIYQNENFSLETRKELFLQLLADFPMIHHLLETNKISLEIAIKLFESKIEMKDDKFSYLCDVVDKNNIIQLSHVISRVDDKKSSFQVECQKDDNNILGIYNLSREQHETQTPPINSIEGHSSHSASIANG